MNWKAHVSIGAVLSIIFVAIMNAWQGWYLLSDLFVVISVIFLILVSPLVPDLDHENGALHNWLIWAGVIIAIGSGIMWFLSGNYGFMDKTLFIYLTTIGVAITTITWLTGEYAHHRGFMHSFTFCLLYGGVVFLLLKFNWQLGILGAFGCLTHDTLDGVFKIK